MYAREFPQNKSGTVRAFEDAYAKEEFLRRSAGQAESRTCTGKPVGEKPAEGTCAPGGSVSVCAPKPEDCRAPEEMPRGDQTPCAKPPSKDPAFTGGLAATVVHRYPAGDSVGSR